MSVPVDPDFPPTFAPAEGAPLTADAVPDGNARLPDGFPSADPAHETAAPPSVRASHLVDVEPDDSAAGIVVGRVGADAARAGSPPGDGTVEGRAADGASTAGAEPETASDRPAPVRRRRLRRRVLTVALWLAVMTTGLLAWGTELPERLQARWWLNRLRQENGAKAGAAEHAFHQWALSGPSAVAKPEPGSADTSADSPELHSTDGGAATVEPAAPSVPTPGDVLEEGPPPDAATAGSPRYRAAVETLAGALGDPDDATFLRAYRLLNKLGALRGMAGEQEARVRRLMMLLTVTPAGVTTESMRRIEAEAPALGDRAEPLMEKLVGSPRAELRAETAALLSRMDRPWAGKLLRGLAGDADSGVRRTAVLRLAAMRDAGAAELLAGVAGGDASADVRSAALVGLAWVNPEAGRAAARRLLDQEPPSLRAAAAYLLGHCAGPSDQAALLARANDASGSDLRAVQAAEALVRAGGRPRAAVERLLDSDDPEVRAGAVGLLVRIRGTAAMERVGRLLQRAEADPLARDGADIGAALVAVAGLGAKAGDADREAVATVARLAAGLATGFEPAGRPARPGPVSIVALRALAVVDREKAAEVAARLILAEGAPDGAGTRSDSLIDDAAGDDDTHRVRAAYWAAHLWPAMGRGRTPGPAATGFAGSLQVLAALRARSRDHVGTLVSKRAVGDDGLAAVVRVLVAHAGAPATPDGRPPAALGFAVDTLGTAGSTAVMLSLPVSREAAWHRLLAPPDNPFGGGAAAATAEWRLRRLGLAAEFAADHPEAPPFDAGADLSVRLLQAEMIGCRLDARRPDRPDRPAGSAPAATITVP